MKRSPVRPTDTPATPPPAASPREPVIERVPLPAPPALAGGPSFDLCLRTRRSTREYLQQPISFDQLGRLLYAAQGCTGLGGLRAAPSAGALYPLRSYVLAASVEGLATGLYSFDSDGEVLRLLRKGDKRKQLARAAAGQSCVEECACALLLTAWYKRSQREFGDAAPRLAAIEAGHIGQNFCLQATALGLGAIGLGRLDSEAVRLLLRLPDDEEPLYLLLAGRV